MRLPLPYLPSFERPVTDLTFFIPIFRDRIFRKIGQDISVLCRSGDMPTLSIGVALSVSGPSKKYFSLCVAVDLLPIVNDGASNLAAPLESISYVAIVGCLLGKLSNRLFALRTGDFDLICDFCESSRALRDYGSVNL